MKSEYSIYCAHPISGLSGDEVHKYYSEIINKLSKMGYNVKHPMVGKGYMRPEIKFKAHGYGNALSTNHAIKERDKWMIINSDIILIDLTLAKNVSIGCISELAWGDLLNKHTIIVMEPSNIHQHAFIIEEADIIFETLDEAVEYLNKLINGEF